MPAIKRAGSRGARGVRLNPESDQRTRAKIQTTQIIKRLNLLIDGKVEMSQTQVTAALGLLRKTLPDLSAVSIEGEVKHTINEIGHQYVGTESTDTDSPGVPTIN